MSTAPLFNSRQLHQTTEGDKDLEALLLSELEATAARCLRTLDKNTDEADWQERLHELKGAAASMGAEALANACALGEQNTVERHHYLPALQRVANETFSTMRAELNRAQPQ